MAVETDVPLPQSFGRIVDFGRTASDYRQFRAGFPSIGVASISFSWATGFRCPATWWRRPRP